MWGAGWGQVEAGVVPVHFLWAHCAWQCLTHGRCMMNICWMDQCVSGCFLGGTSVAGLAGKASPTQDSGGTSASPKCLSMHPSWPPLSAVPAPCIVSRSVYGLMLSLFALEEKGGMPKILGRISSYSLVYKWSGTLFLRPVNEKKLLSRFLQPPLAEMSFHLFLIWKQVCHIMKHCSACLGRFFNPFLPALCPAPSHQPWKLIHYPKLLELEIYGT